MALHPIDLLASSTLDRTLITRMVTQEQMDNLLATKRYSLDILPTLEQFLDQQIQSSSYHFEANLTLLKFYQFHPENTNIQYVAKALLKAVMNLPTTDLLLSLALVAENVLEEEPVRTIVALANLLETAKFGAFWTEAKAAAELLDRIPGFYDAIRGFISNVVLQTYRSIDKKTFAELLNLSITNVDALINAKGWEQNDEFVTFPRTETDTANAKKMENIIKWEDLSRILSSIRQ